MRITVIPAEGLTEEHLAAWSDIQQSDPALGSPYFCPEFTQVVASVRSDVFVAVLEDEGRPCGFLPFQRRRGTGRPVGAPLSDFQGVVAREATAFCAEEVIRAAGLASWRFDHLLAWQKPFRAAFRVESPSPFIDLSQGFDAYQEARRAAGSRDIPEILRQMRVIHRRLGPLRFEFHTDDQKVFDQLLGWKAGQYARTGLENILARPWVVGLLNAIRGRQGEMFAGVLSALYVGDRLAAVHFGMRSRAVLHYWFPAYDPELSTYSPGRICLLELVRAAAALGIRRVDLGKGDEPYKTRLMSAATPVAEGVVLCHPVARVLEHAWQGARSLKQHPIVGTPVRLAARLSRPLRQWLRRT